MNDILFQKKYQHKKLWINILNQTPMGVMITKTDGVICYVNPAMAIMTGYDEHELLGEKPSILSSHLHDEAFYQQLWETLIKGETWHGEIYNKKKDGTCYWESQVISPVMDEKGKITHYIAFKQDITEKKRLQDRLKSLAQYPEKNPNPVICLAMDGTIRFANSASKPVLESWQCKVGEMAPDKVRKGVITALEKETSQIIEQKIGNQFYRLTFTPLTDLKQVYVYGEDISLQIKTEKMKQNFVASISHELRHPLAVILSSLDLLRVTISDPLSKEASTFLEMASKRGKEMLALINDLLDYQKLTSGNMAIAFKKVNALDFLEKIYANHSMTCNGFHMVLKKPEVMNPWVILLVNERRLGQVFTNLISNAKKNSPPGSTITLGIEYADSYVRFFVKDEGKGIDLTEEDNIFDPFVQGRESGYLKSKGWGLGLMISKEIVENHGGAIHFTSQLGKGSTFFVDLPIAEIVNTELKP